MMRRIKEALLTVGLLYTPMLVAEPLTPNQLHATMGIVTNFILNDGKNYKSIVSPHTGRVWLDRNMGANRVCTSFDDAQCYGDYYQWGRGYDGHQESGSGIITTQASDVTNVGHGDFITADSTNNFDWAKNADDAGITRAFNWYATDGSSVCPVGFRVPTKDELKAETLDNGVINNATAFTNFLKLPSAGYRHYLDGSMGGVGSSGDVWASSVDGSYSHTLYFDSGEVNTYIDYRANGYSVRCLRD